MVDLIPLPHMPGEDFFRKDGELMIGDFSLSRLAAQIGSSSFYAYDRRLVSARINRLRASLPVSVKLHYAMKANPMPALVCFMAGLVDGVDVASAGELQVALNAGVLPKNISFAGPGKRYQELRQSVAAGVLLNLESERELSVLASISDELGLPVRIAVRVNPAFELKGAGMRMGGGSKQFGIDAERVPDVLAEIGRLGLGFEGFHLYAGSQNLNSQIIAESQRLLYLLAKQLADHAPSEITVLNLGGGFGIPYFPGERGVDLPAIGANLQFICEQMAADFPRAELVLELGRYLVGEAGVYVTQVVDRKRSRDKTFLVTDGGLNHHLAASGNFGQVLRKNFPVRIGNRMDDLPLETVSVVGPLCTPLDLLADQMVLPAAQIGDWVVVFQSGAYGASASPQAFLGQPGVKEVLVGS